MGLNLMPRALGAVLASVLLVLLVHEADTQLRSGLDAQAVALLDELLAERMRRHAAAGDGAIVLTSHLAPRFTPTATLDLDGQRGVL
jgi:ABC-type transport system involved in cytochrome c biogenesis ATPase subunit